MEPASLASAFGLIHSFNSLGSSTLAEYYNYPLTNSFTTENFYNLFVGVWKAKIRYRWTGRLQQGGTSGIGCAPSLDDG